MSGAWWRLTRGLAWLMVRGYYRSYRVEHAERIPAAGPVLFVLNHPNALIDPLALILATRRPVRLAAKEPLFQVPVLGFILRRIGAVPVERPKDAGSDLRKNLSTFSRMADALREGGACAIFPEGTSHEDPELKAVKSGPARIALEAEESAGWTLGLRVVPVGLSFHPRQVFRGDVVVRVGEPFEVRDLKEENRHRAIRAVQERIADSLRPLVHHLDRVELSPLVDAVAELVAEQRRTNPGAGPALPPEEVRRIAGAALNHFLLADPAAVEEVGRLHSRYRRMSGRAAVPGAAVDFHDRPVRAFFAFLGRGLLLVLGFPVFLFGLCTGLVPYRLTDRIADALAPRAGGATAAPLLRILAGAVVFGAWWGLLCLLVRSWSASDVVTAVFAVALVVLGLGARAYAQRARRWSEALEALLPYFARRGTVRRVAAARAELLTKVEILRSRYEAESGVPLIPPAQRRFRTLVPWRKGAAILFAGGIGWFAMGLRGTGMAELGTVPSPWKDLPAAEAASGVERDARALLGGLDALESLETRMTALRGEIESGRKDFYDPATDREIRGQLLTYLSCREGLLRLAWYYRDPEREPADTAAKGFLVGYAAGAELVARGMQLVDTFARSPAAIRKLNEGDPAGEVPAGIFERIRGNIADEGVLDSLAAASTRFGALSRRGALPRGPAWERIAARAAAGERVVAGLGERLWRYKWDHAVARALATGDEGRYRASSILGTWIGDTRIRRRVAGHGLVGPEQVEALRRVLRPGDILIERRNWYLSNAFLPGFWKHSALYLGGVEGLESLGIAGDPAAASWVADLRLPDGAGHRKVIEEAISEGVRFTSLEESIGGADAVCVLRPRLPAEEIARCVRRGLAEHGKPYDFDFDFFSTDRLVCTEVIFQSYQAVMPVPLVEIMGRRTLPPAEYVRLWDEGRSKPTPALDLVAFYDADEIAGTAREAGAPALHESLARSGITPLQADPSTGVPLLLHPTFAALLAMTGAALWVFRRRKPRPRV